MGGRTPLFLASKLGCLQSVKLLLAYKAKPNIKSHSGESSLEVAYNYKVKSFLMKARSVSGELNVAAYLFTVCSERRPCESMAVGRT